MTKKRKPLINPNSISGKEMAFIKGNASSGQNNKRDNHEDDIGDNTKNFKGYMISMPVSFEEDLRKFLKENPTEGNKSAFIVRVVGEYIKEKRSSF